jgi:glyoxylase-like metal-dependent hydrolase (beta-lactamase superfamily II)
VRAIALHPDVLLVTSAVLAVNCVIVRGPADAQAPPVTSGSPGETFVIDSLVLPDEHDALPALLGQAGFPAPSGLLATHGDWDHLLARLAFPVAALGCAESTAERLQAAPGEAQRSLRAFDEELMIRRTRPLALGAVQALPVPGRCALGDRELELHPTAGHVADGMAVLAPWAGVMVVGDYISPVELPTLAAGGLESYLETLARLRGLIERVEHVVPGHGQVLDRPGATAVLEEDEAYLRDLAERGAEAELPTRCSGAWQRRLHGENAVAIAT